MGLYGRKVVVGLTASWVACTRCAELAPITIGMFYERKRKSIHAPGPFDENVIRARRWQRNRSNAPGTVRRGRGWGGREIRTACTGLNDPLPLFLYLPFSCRLSLSISLALSIPGNCRQRVMDVNPMQPVAKDEREGIARSAISLTNDTNLPQYVVSRTSRAVARLHSTTMVSFKPRA